MVPEPVAPPPDIPGVPPPEIPEPGSPMYLATKIKRQRLFNLSQSGTLCETI
jgi:hypothetical protein